MVKSPLVLLHGALGSSRYFQPFIVTLKNDFEVYTLNFEGHGDRLSNEPFSVDLFAQNLIDFLLENKLEKVTIFGYSMGGYVALKVAKEQPQLIGKIITLGTKFKWDPAIATKEISMLNPALIEEKIPKFAANLQALHEPADWKVVMAKTAAVMQLLGDGKGLKPTDFQEIKQKVVIGIGELDKMVTINESQLIVDVLPNAHLKILPHVVHPIEMIEQQTLIDFIKENT